MLCESAALRRSSRPLLWRIRRLACGNFSSAHLLSTRALTRLTMARQSTLLAAALLLPAAHAIRPSTLSRRDAIKAAPPAFLLASRPAWARYDDYKDGPRGLKYIVT